MYTKESIVMEIVFGVVKALAPRRAAKAFAFVTGVPGVTEDVLIHRNERMLLNQAGSGFVELDPSLIPTLPLPRGGTKVALYLEKVDEKYRASKWAVSS